MSVEVEKEMLNAIFAARDEEYADFTAKLIPNVPRESIIGVRTPQLRSIAKRFGKNAGIDEFLSALPHEYHEQNLVHAYIAESIGDFDFAVKTIEAFLPYVTNWAVCDSMTPRVFAKHTGELLPIIKKWLQSAHPYTVRFGLRMLMCFYLEKESQFTHEKWMDDSTLKEFIKQYIAASGNQVYFTWQGGEPTLAGLDFFRKVIHYQQRYAGQKRIFNALQTNGILLNNEWCAFLKEHEFLVGISIDGPQELHDRYRRSNSGNGTFAKVIAAIERLKSYQVEFNTLTVINNVNVHYPLEVYHFLKSIGSKHMQFIELLETGTPNIDFSGHSENTFRIIDFSVPPTAYGKFMSTIFMQWVKNDVGEIFIRQFESFVSRFLGNGHTSCIFQESCKDNLVVESNGDIYECDHFVYPQYKIGNINKSELKTMNSVQLTAQKKRIPAKCQQCAYKPICNGGCPKHRITKVNNETVSYFCEGYKILFSTMVPYMNAMVELAKNRVPLYHIMDVAKQMENN